MDTGLNISYITNNYSMTKIFSNFNNIYMCIVVNIGIAFHMFFMINIIMPTDKPRILLTLSEELLEEIDDYRYKNRIPARTEAIRQLIRKSLPKKKVKKEQSDKQKKLF